MGDLLGSSRVSSQKQNREGVVGAQSGQYRATVESSLGCDGGPGWDHTYLTICVVTRRVPSRVPVTLKNLSVL
ncbi:hypothetical protein DVH24_019286 [Malus domestica]|uniref:Uncharacterized protein n=1 Tax=Malus domestica TaxID=3750 RepID=A0A498HXP1_MALDO|nr:hypothetical protein DVH24_019286 [Malus domestica]